MDFVVKIQSVVIERKTKNVVITCCGKQQDFDSGSSYIVVAVIVTLRAVASWTWRRPGVASHCTVTRRSSLPTHLIDDRLQLRDRRQPVWRHVRWRLQSQFAQNVVSYRRVAIMAFCLHDLHLSVYTIKLLVNLLLHPVPKSWPPKQTITNNCGNFSRSLQFY